MTEFINRNIRQSVRDEQQMKEMIQLCKDMVLKTAEDIKKLETDFASNLRKDCGKQLTDKVKEIVDLDQKISDEFEAYRRAMEQIQMAFDAVREIDEPGWMAPEAPDDLPAEGNLDDEEATGGSGDDEDDELGLPSPRSRARRSTSKRMSKQKGKKKASLSENTIISGKVDLFQENLNSIKAARKRRKSDGTLKALKNLLKSSPQAAAVAGVDGDNSEEEDLVASDVETIPIDPFTNKEVERPVKNIKCGHIYDKEGIMTYINSKERPRCPAIGCANKFLTVADLVDDEETRIKIQRIMALRDDTGSSDE